MSSGYSSSAIRERIYFGDDMSGVLLYTGSADKEGSLGGLVELGNIDQLIVLMKDAFQEALVCTNDPECLNNVPAGNNSNGAACHSCCMISETAWVYQHIYSVSRIDRSKNVIALFVGDTYDEIDSDIVQIDSRADVIIFSSSVVTAKMDLMQRFFGFEQYIRAGAQKTIEIIRDLDIVDSLEKFVAFENKSKLTNAKKLLKAKNSPVLQMKKNDLLENLKKHSRYKTMFKFEEDHIVISSQKEAAAFIKMLNDDIVRSELTGKEYDSSSKMLLGPVGASH